MDHCWRIGNILSSHFLHNISSFLNSDADDLVTVAMIFMKRINYLVKLLHIKLLETLRWVRASVKKFIQLKSRNFALPSSCNIP